MGNFQVRPNRQHPVITMIERENKCCCKQKKHGEVGGEERRLASTGNPVNNFYISLQLHRADRGILQMKDLKSQSSLSYTVDHSKTDSLPFTHTLKTTQTESTMSLFDSSPAVPV